MMAHLRYSGKWTGKCPNCDINSSENLINLDSSFVHFCTLLTSFYSLCVSFNCLIADWKPQKNPVPQGCYFCSEIILLIL